MQTVTVADGKPRKDTEAADFKKGLAPRFTPCPSISAEQAEKPSRIKSCDKLKARRGKLLEPLCAATKPDSRKEETMNNKINILYERLSHEDGRENESLSIENQKAYLEEYATRNGFTNIVHMSDDGWSGTRWDRPAFLRICRYRLLLTK
jgi:Resolvase, N terminal domain.